MSRSAVTRDLLRRFFALQEFGRLHERTVAISEAQGIVSEDELLKEFSLSSCEASEHVGPRNDEAGGLRVEAAGIVHPVPQFPPASADAGDGEDDVLVGRHGGAGGAQDVELHGD